MTLMVLRVAQALLLIILLNYKRISISTSRKLSKLRKKIDLIIYSRLMSSMLETASSCLMYTKTYQLRDLCQNIEIPC